MHSKYLKCWYKVTIKLKEVSLWNLFFGEVLLFIEMKIKETRTHFVTATLTRDVVGAPFLEREKNYIIFLFNSLRIRSNSNKQFLGSLIYSTLWLGWFSGTN